jgi:uncharacterized protein YciI
VGIDLGEQGNRGEEMNRRALMSTLLVSLAGAQYSAPSGAQSGEKSESGPAQPAPGQASPQGSAPDSPLFAVEFRTGPGWDSSKPASEQAHFREHSANLARLRKEGRVVVGARYSDKGFIVMTGSSADDVRVLLDADPAVQRRVFDVEVNEFFVFYGGCVAAASRRR